MSTNRLTIKEAMAFYGKSDKTIRRWIKIGKVEGEMIDGLLYVYPEPDDEQPSASPNDQADSEKEQMQSEITHLREQVDKLTSIVALSTQQNNLMLEKLPTPNENNNGRPDGKRVFRFLDVFRRG